MRWKHHRANCRSPTHGWTCLWLSNLSATGLGLLVLQLLASVWLGLLELHALLEICLGIPELLYSNGAGNVCEHHGSPWAPWGCLCKGMSSFKVTSEHPSRGTFEGHLFVTRLGAPWGTPREVNVLTEIVYQNLPFWWHLGAPLEKHIFVSVCITFGGTLGDPWRGPF